MWTTQETIEDAEPTTLHTFASGSLEFFPAPNIIFCVRLCFNVLSGLCVNVYLVMLLPLTIYGFFWGGAGGGV